MKKRLVILSDLWGINKSQWVDFYREELSMYFDIVYYDCCKLGELSNAVYMEESLHRQFVDGGIERAVQRLAELEKDRVDILAFSIGGAIAWRFGIETSRIDSLYCVSSTRLRYENAKPSGKIELYYGEKDKHKPQQDWFNKMEVFCEIITDRDHLVYTEPEFAKRLCNHILKNHKIAITTNL
jgi:pimeloyl-ACP methyl ester carboxylesterase